MAIYKIIYNIDCLGEIYREHIPIDTPNFNNKEEELSYFKELQKKYYNREFILK